MSIKHITVTARSEQGTLIERHARAMAEQQGLDVDAILADYAQWLRCLEMARKAFSTNPAKPARGA